MAEFNANLRDHGSVSVIDLKGYLDAHTAPDLENVFNSLINKKQFQVVVNFNELKYISSAGLGVFMAYVETMRENSGDIKFSNMKDNVFNIFDLLGFPMLYEFYKDETDAVQKFIK
ncbi:MAG: STAS domain-containing protein [Melioribacteraceae bacterium]|jgi:anti-sigma B factor antagonist|nr:STAS domain-containing protein [Melioribacteraceae bacterium]